MKIAPHVMDGPDEGIGGHYKGLSGSVWQWVDTSLYTRCDPYEHPTTADEDSGFRRARTVSAWPDADVWLSRLH